MATSGENVLLEEDEKKIEVKFLILCADVITSYYYYYYYSFLC